ncbi:hypothetical protein HU200_050033 [Digitaria exilis]|uniref:DUF641 domain-containing protein n=1 Tax=Digitaria exilis TaxID=1010633 RepID=A0A835AYJ3_9POAL|nr:hypothetical protein HU200_050033 [Digitaria exilis]CAB3488875.1 unnamed protein product [Digitaria exilis]
MESPRTSLRTPTCTVPGLLVGLTKLCKLTKVCAAPTLGDEAKSRLGTSCGGYDQRLLLIRLFEAMGSLKSAYVKLQRAHFPYYDPGKIAFADEIITSELDSVTALQSLCSSSCGIGSLVNDRWSVVQELEAEARKRDSDIVLLKKELERLQRDNSRLNKQIKSGKPSSVKHPNKGFDVRKELATATPSALLELFKVASASVHDFAEMIASSLMSSDGCSVSNADAAEQSCIRRYSVEAHLWRTIMVGASPVSNEEEKEVFDGIMRFCDPMDALMQYPRSSFSVFCRSRYLAAVPSEAEAAMFGNKLEQRALVSHGGHPRTWFYRAFAAMARSAWALRLLMARHGDVRMFYARRGSEYAEEWMQSVAAPASDGHFCGGVAFTVAPGLKFGDTVVPCRVLLLSQHLGELQPSPTTAVISRLL